MPRYELTVEDADGAVVVDPTDEVVMSMSENLAVRQIPGRIGEDPNGVYVNTDANLGALAAAGDLRVLMANDPGYVAGMTTYMLEEIGEDPAGGVYNARFSVPAGGRRRRGKKTRASRKPKRKARLTRRR
jgi:hypothetical protein